jgi:fused signal recognition particle receptor
MKLFKRKRTAKEQDPVAVPAVDDAPVADVPAEPPAAEEAVADEVTAQDTVDAIAVASDAKMELESAGTEPAPEAVKAEQVKPAVATDSEVSDEPASSGFFSRLKQGLKRTGGGFAQGMGTFLLGKKEIDDDVLEDLETALLLADVGVEATNQIVENLSGGIKRKELADGEAVVEALKAELAQLLETSEQPLVIDGSHKPFVILVVGVNGVGKTTTIGKLARRYRDEGKSVMLAAGDTFRAAAVEQLQAWGERNNVPVIAQQTGSDSASVLYDALEAATARGVDILIADTAGRLHNKDNLMDELKKVVRVMGKVDASAPHETLLVLDAGTGQNALSQASAFQSVVNVSGLALTKLDGTAKGGVIFAISKETGLPVRYIGVGEAVEDLRPFKADEFVSALFEAQS